MTKSKCVMILEKLIEEIKAMDTNKEVFIEIDDNNGDSYCCAVDDFKIKEGRFGIFITNVDN